MRRLAFAAAIGALLALGAGCQKGEEDAAALDARMTRLSESLANADSTKESGDPIARWILPSLPEISGIALTPDGRLFAHDDETAQITEIDYRRGVVIKRFFVGEDGFHGDFEGLTCAGDRFFLLTSDGNLCEFAEGAEGDHVEYTAHDTQLSKDCEFEGLAYDSTANAIILACKNAIQAQDALVLYRYRLDEDGADPSQFTVPYAEVIGENKWKQMRPTDIAIDPSSGNYVLVAAQEKALVVLTPSGKVVLSRELGGRHPQSEGIAITQDHILIIADEATNGPATITLYYWPGSGVRDGVPAPNRPLRS